MTLERQITTEEYAAVFKNLNGKITASQWRMLQEFLRAPQHTLTATAAAEVAGFKTYRSFNAHFGALSRMFCDSLDCTPGKEWDGKSYKTSVLAILHETTGREEYRWRLRPEVVEHLRTIETDLNTCAGSTVAPDPPRPGHAGHGAAVLASPDGNITTLPCVDIPPRRAIEAAQQSRSVPEDGRRMFRLIDEHGRQIESEVPGTLGGYRPKKIYGRLTCSSARNAIAKGGYVTHRVFFADEPTAIRAGYRPCAKCMPVEYDAWKAGRLA